MTLTDSNLRYLLAIHHLAQQSTEVSPLALAQTLLAGGKPLVQGGKSGAALGQLLFPVLQGQQPGGSIFQRGQLLFSSGQRCVQCGQLGAFRFGLGSGQLGSIPRGLLLMAQGIQLIVGGKGRLCLRHLAGKNIQLGGIACVAGALGTGSFQHRQGSGKLCLLCGQCSKERIGRGGLFFCVKSCPGFSQFPKRPSMQAVR